MPTEDTLNIYEQLIFCQTSGIVSISVNKLIKLKFVLNYIFFWVGKEVVVCSRM